MTRVLTRELTTELTTEPRTPNPPAEGAADGLAEPPGPAVAVVGMSCRFPGAPGIPEFWRNLRDGVESIRFFTPQDLAAAGVDPAILGYPGYVNAGAVLDGADLFDASFFGFSARDAEILDPQQRIFLEECWRTLEDAGCDPSTTGGLIGVYAGVDMSRYMFNLLSNHEIMATAGILQITIANDKDHLTTRVSYKLNLRGPAVTVQTTCSTSLVAVCQACQGLLTYQCDAALAGGSAITFPQTSGYVYQEGGVSSPDGHCRAFDAAAHGTVGGNGVGVVLLMRLEDALAGGYPVRAVIRGFGLSNDGSGKVGYTAPGIEGQAEAIATAQGMAGFAPETITYVEAHGTGTPLGDPIEIAALSRVFGARTSKRGFCGIGSVKTNVGHLNSAAGVAGLIKTVLALEHRQLPPSLHFRAPNPKLRLDGSPFYVVDRLRSWPANGIPRRAGVSSFGIGGTNAHVVVEEAPAAAPSGPSRPCQLLVLSARTASALDTATANLAAHLRANPGLPLADVAFTLQAGRQAFEHRRALVVPEGPETPEGTVEAACRALETGEGVLTARRPEGSRPVAFLFPGQGAQHPGMGAQVYRTEPVYREQLDRCAELLAPHLGLDLRAILHPAPGEEPAAAERLARTDAAQPALFAVEYSLARLWESWGIRPEAMLGHSLGEYVAACLAGVFSLEDALALVAARGRLMQGMPEGAMLAVHLPEAEAAALLDPELSLAAVNGPALCVVAGPPAAVRDLEERLAARDVGVRRLHTAQAFHSADVDALMEPFEEEVARVALSAPQIPFLSNFTGTWITPSQATDPAYWSSHMRRTVRFGEGLRRLLAEPGRVLLEAGPGRPLASLALAQARPEGTVVISSLPHPQDRRPEPEMLLEGLGRLWLSGVRIDWRGFAAGEERRRVSLPAYPFERQRYWVDPTPVVVSAAGAAPVVQRQPLDDWFYQPVWQEAPRDPAPRQEGRKLNWVLFADAAGIAGLAEQLEARLAGEGQEVVLVRPGAGFGRSGEREFTLDPVKPAGYTALLKELRSRRLIPDRLVHLWAVTGDGDCDRDRSMDELQALSFYSPVFLAQAVTDQLGPHPVELTVVADRAFAARDGDAVEPIKAMAAGACLVIAQELPTLACRFLDPGPNGAEGLLEELAAGRDEILVALRGGRRLVRRFAPVQLAGPGATAGTPRLREQGVYLITGGLGGIGLTVARRLAERVRARLLLLTRAFPPRERWDDPSLAPDVARRIQQVREIEALGAEVEVIQGDVARRDDVERVASLAASRFGGLHGIVHSAGVAGGGLLQLKTYARASQVLAPKVAGTLALDQVFAGAELDFFILCSSLSSLLGGPGQVDYCAANAFLDSFAARERSRGGRLTVSVGWDTWAEVGMAVNTAIPTELEGLRQENLRQAITPAEGADVFERILSIGAGGLSQVAVSTSDLPARIRQWTRQEDTAVTPAPVATGAPVRHRRPELSTPYRAPGNETERIIAEIWQELLGVEPVGADDRFLDLGGHSLLAGQVVSRLRVALQVDLPMRTVFEASTLADLAQLVELEMQGEESPLEDFQPLPSAFGFAQEPQV